MTTSPTTTRDEQIAKLKAEFPEDTIVGDFVGNPVSQVHDYSGREVHDAIDRTAQLFAEREAKLRGRIFIRLNDYLCEMKPDTDDSITGFNEAWQVVRGAFDGLPWKSPLDQLWDKVNALGGVDTEDTTGKAVNDTVDRVLAYIEELGDMGSASRKALPAPVGEGEKRPVVGDLIHALRAWRDEEISEGRMREIIGLWVNLQSFTLPPVEDIKAVTNDAQIKHMVNRFLGWSLPESFGPDGGISFKRLQNPGMPQPYPMPTGTNLFDVNQAEAMVRYMLDGLLPARSTPSNPGEWQDIGDKPDKSVAPWDGTHFLACDWDGGMYRAYYDFEGEYFAAKCGQPVVEPVEPIYWQPLPPPPLPVTEGEGS